MEQNDIANLSLDEKILFLQVIFNLICVDNKIEKQENEFIKGLIKDYGISKDLYSTVLCSLSRAEILQKVKSISDDCRRYTLLIELFMVANIDSNINDREIDFIFEVAEAWDVDYNKVELINRYSLNKINNIIEYNVIMQN